MRGEKKGKGGERKGEERGKGGEGRREEGEKGGEERRREEGNEYMHVCLLVCLLVLSFSTYTV